MKRTLSILIPVILLSIIGVVMITSSSIIWAEYKFDDPYKYFKSQFIFFIVSFIILLIISKIDYKTYYKNSNKIMFCSTLLLILVLIPGIGTIRNGSRSWFGIGGLGIQPSEFMKLSIIIFISKYLSNNEKSIREIKKGVFPILGFIMLIFGLIMLQPDFGTGIIIVMISISLLFVAGVNFNFFFKIGFLGVIGIVALIVVAPYRLKRIVSFLNPWNDPLGSGFQIIQSLYAIGPGRPLQKR
ncbi:MAG: FtsW/RodA/SpoVE family cell cycle protein [Bacilli bacterium]